MFSIFANRKMFGSEPQRKKVGWPKTNELTVSLSNKFTQEFL